MPSLDENALTILRVMRDNRSVGTVAEIAILTGLSEEDFDEADTYLLKAKYLKGTMGGWEGARWLEPLGVNHLRTELFARLPLSLDAEWILRYIVEHARPNKPHSQRPQIMAELNLDDEQYRLACRKLLSANLIKDIVQQGFCEVVAATPEGERAVDSEFRKADALSIQNNTGMVVHGDVTGGNILAVASAVSSNVEQAIKQNDPNAVQQALAETIDALVKNVSNALTLEQQALYTQKAVELKEEAAKNEPDPNVLQKLLSFLSFGDTLGGTLQLGVQSFALAAAAAPYVPALYQAIQHLLK